MLTSGLDSRLQLALLLPVLVDGDALSLVHFLPARNEWRGLGSEWLRRSDSNRRPSGYEPDELPLLHSAVRIIPPPWGPSFSGVRGGRCGRRGRRGWRCRSRHQVEALLLAGVSVQTSLFLVGSARGNRLHVLAIALVLRRQAGILAMQVGHLLAQLVADVGLLCECIGGPYGDHRHHRDDDGATYSMRAGAHAACGNYGFAVSHAASLLDVRVDEVPTITNRPRGAVGGPAERFGDPGGPAARRGRVAQRAHRRCVSEPRRPQQRR